MPIYTFSCSNCDHREELLIKYELKPPHCSNCGLDTLVRQLSKPKFHLKGTGWYVTDFKNPTPTSNSTNNSTKEDPKKEVKQEAKQDTKEVKQEAKESKQEAKQEAKESKQEVKKEAKQEIKKETTKPKDGSG
ncbi:MAG: zinc ribbon domain-containing protein [Methylacidiphilales bacterium]|nr:zinc ribbon domain-containing protein [Candidatus Methylacidiphilales bacterium]